LFDVYIWTTFLTKSFRRYIWSKVEIWYREGKVSGHVRGFNSTTGYYEIKGVVDGGVVTKRGAKFVFNIACLTGSLVYYFTARCHQAHITTETMYHSSGNGKPAK
jgi:hypothetical protein